MYKRLGWGLRRNLMVPMGIEPFDTRGYIRKVLTPDGTSGYDPAGLIGFWPQNEAAGGVSFDHSGLGHDGAYTGVTLGQPGVPDMGMTSPYYDGTNDYNNIFSVALAAAFNGAELTFLLWNRWTAAVLTDGLARVLTEISVDAGNFVRFQRDVVNNQFSLRRNGGGVLEVTTFISAATAFQVFAVTVSETAGEVIGYLNGVQQGVIHTPIGAWVGNINLAIIGALNLVPNNVVDGWLAPALLYNEAKTPAEIAYLSTV